MGGLNRAGHALQPHQRRADPDPRAAGKDGTAEAGGPLNGPSAPSALIHSQEEAGPQFNSPLPGQLQQSHCQILRATAAATHPFF